MCLVVLMPMVRHYIEFNFIWIVLAVVENAWSPFGDHNVVVLFTLYCSQRISFCFSWFQTFAVFWMLYAFFWVIPRCLNFICQRFRTPCLFHLHRQLGESTRTYLPMEMKQTECSEKSAYKIQTPGNYPKESIQQVSVIFWSMFMFWPQCNMEISFCVNHPFLSTHSLHHGICSPL